MRPLQGCSQIWTYIIISIINELVDQWKKNQHINSLEKKVQKQPCAMLVLIGLGTTGFNNEAGYHTLYWAHAIWALELHCFRNSQYYQYVI